MTATPAVIFDSRRATRLVLGATVAVVAALVLIGLLVAVLVGRADGGDTALGLGLAALGAVLLGAGLLVVARAGALARHPAATPRAASLLTRCVLAATVGAVAVAVTGIAAASGSDAVAPGLGAGAASLALVGLAAFAGRSRHRLQARSATPPPRARSVPVIPAQRTAEPTPVAGGASENGPAADAR